ncbi:MAG TPA: transglutaminase-like domain-containing protein [Bryobacteraceae bacterium]|nr:transglutaminase-like domain-containing protein [Bryobacteraceae bacterium]
MHELRELLQGGPGDPGLDVAALQIATVEYPEIFPSSFVELLDSYGRELKERVNPTADGEEFIQTMNEYLFEELGFQGNQDDYYHPANSCLNEVLTKRTGIPISLSVVYMEIARRVGRKVHGIGLPGHFIVQYEDADITAFIDPFHAGRLMFETECYELAHEITGLDISSDSTVLKPVSKRQILIRMLNNLRSVYFQRQQPLKAIEVLNLLIEADPGSPDEYKQRGVCLAQVNRFAQARADLEAYLKLSPDAADREPVSQQIERINRYLAAL